MPIHCLPDDVLVIIFESCSVLEPPHLTSLGWVKLSHVDRRWRALILDLPLLWSRVVCSFGPEMARETVLRRALDLPLSLYFPTLWSYRVVAPGELINRLLPRARLISCRSDQRGSLLLDGRSLPLLEELDIDEVRGLNKRLHAPCLRRLVIHAIPWTISAENLQSLRILLDDEVERLNPHIVHLPNVLATLPALESFKFKVTARYGVRESEAGVTSAVHSIRRSIRGALTALDQGKPVVFMQCLTFMEVEANTHGSPHGQFAAFLATMFWRSLRFPHINNVHFVISEQFQPILQLLEVMQTHISTPQFDTFQITHHWPGLEFSLSHNNAEAAGRCGYKLPSCDRTSFVVVLRYFSGSIGEHLHTLRLFSLSSPGPDLGGHTGITTNASHAEGYSSIEFIEVHGPASLLAHVLGLYAFARLRTVILHIPQHDHHELRALSRALRARPSGLKRLVLRGPTAYSDETKFAREIHALRFSDTVEVVVDERNGLVEHVQPPRIFKAGDGVARLPERRESTVDGSGGSSKAVTARIRTDSRVHLTQTANAGRGGTGATTGRTAWH